MIMFLTLAASAVLAGASPVTVGQVETIQLPVSYADLDLTSTKGRRTFDRRIESAARTICGIGYDRHDLTVETANTQCRVGVRASAKQQAEVAITRATNNGGLAAAASIIAGK